MPIEQGARLWDLLWEAGRPHGIVPVGIGVYGTTGRLEKGYRAFGFELDGEYDVVEAGMAWGKVKDAGLRRQGGARPPPRAGAGGACMCTLTVDDHTSASGVQRYMLGREPILTRDGAPLVDAKGRRSFVTSAGAGPSVGKHMLMAYLPPEHAREGEELAVEYMAERYPVTVAVAGSTPIFDPENARIRSMNVLVCVKRVPITGGKIVLTADERAIETRHLGFTISPHEECGVEEAVRIVEAHGGESVTVLTLGPAGGRGAAARRAWRSASTARSCWRPTAPTGTPRRRPPRSSTRSTPSARPAPFDLIVFGTESADSGNYQVGIRVAHALGRPCVTGLKGARGRGRPRALRAGGRRRARRLRRPAAGGRDGQGGHQPAALPVRARRSCAPSASRSSGARPAARAPRLEMVRLAVPPGPGKQAEVLGEGPARRPRRGRGAAPAGGGVMVLVFVEAGGDELVPAGADRSRARSRRRAGRRCRRSGRRGAGALGAHGVATVHVAEHDARRLRPAGLGARVAQLAERPTARDRGRAPTAATRCWRTRP